VWKGDWAIRTWRFFLSLSLSLILSFFLSFACFLSFILSFSHSFIISFFLFLSFVLSFIHSFFHSFSHSFIHSFFLSFFLSSCSVFWGKHSMQYRSCQTCIRFSAVWCFSHGGRQDKKSGIQISLCRNVWFIPILTREVTESYKFLCRYHTQPDGWTPTHFSHRLNHKYGHENCICTRTVKQFHLLGPGIEFQESPPKLFNILWSDGRIAPNEQHWALQFSCSVVQFTCFGVQMRKGRQ